MNQTSSITRLTLLPAVAPQGRAADEPKVRRYRLATVRPQPGAAATDRFAHLKRAYD